MEFIALHLPLKTGATLEIIEGKQKRLGSSGMTYVVINDALLC